VKEQLEPGVHMRSQEKREEMTRIERARKQQFYNGDLIAAYNQEQDIEFELILEKDRKTTNPVIDVSLLLVINMKLHQSRK
jgi:hypothetical protein